MDIVTGILLSATLINAVKNLYELTFMIDDDPAKERRLKYTTSNYDRNRQIRHYFLTLEGNRIIEVEPAD